MKGDAVVLVAQTVGARRALAQNLTLRSLLLVGVMGAIAIGGMIFAVRHALAPIGRLEMAIKNRDPLDLTTIDVTAPRELQPFVSEINHFIERLRNRIELMQRFIADAAHQLRTPLTALNGQIDLLSHDQVSDEGRKHLDRIRARVTQLSRLANQLLSHAMVAHRERAVGSSIVDMTELTRRALSEAVPDTLERDILVTFQSSSSRLEIMGDPVNLAEAIKNLIDNAVRHGAPTQIAVHLYREAHYAVIDVADDGPGIPRERWSLVAARFGAASFDAKGSGLGLSIAAAVAAAHRGGLSFKNDAEGRFVAELRFSIDGRN
jgi:two-component system sensor histidine kinase TctE